MKTAPIPERLLQATRLTRAGRLGEATAMLRDLLRGAVESVPNFARDIAETVSPVIDFAVSRSEAAAPRRDKTADPGVPRGARFLDGVFSNDAGSRPYRLYVPASYRGHPAPLVVMLHGCTQSPDDFAAGTGMNILAEEQGLLVLYPAQTHAANARKCWNWFKPRDQRRGEGEPSVIAGMTRDIMEKYTIDPARVYAAGLSAGGAAAAILGANYPDLYAAIGVHSGVAYGAASGMGSGFRAMREGRPGAGRYPIPAIIIHGDQDSVVHPANADAVATQFGPEIPCGAVTEQGQVPDGHAYTVTRHTTPDGLVLMESWTIHGAGHAWSGGSQAGTYTDRQGPDASRAMLRFFALHRGRDGLADA